MQFNLKTGYSSSRLSARHLYSPIVSDPCRLIDMRPIMTFGQLQVERVKVLQETHTGLARA